jgi:predicted P-loop ATPase/GTPase
MQSSFKIFDSLFIPRLFSNISKDEIRNVFEKYGVVDYIDLVAKPGGHNSAYVHFKMLYCNDLVILLNNDLNNPEKQARVVYNNPWYWIVLKNTSAKRIGSERRKEKIQIHNDHDNDQVHLHHDINDLYYLHMEKQELKEHIDEFEIKLNQMNFEFEDLKRHYYRLPIRQSNRVIDLDNDSIEMNYNCNNKY